MHSGENAPHLQEDIPDFFSDFEKRVKRSSISLSTLGVKVVFFEGGCLPGSPEKIQMEQSKNRDAYDVNISTVKSVSGLAVEVLNSDPLRTVNHWPFLC
jgi:hypothetical protein